MENGNPRVNCQTASSPNQTRGTESRSGNVQRKQHYGKCNDSDLDFQLEQVGRICRQNVCARQVNTSFAFNSDKAKFMVSLGHVSEVSNISLKKTGLCYRRKSRAEDRQKDQHIENQVVA